MLSHLLGLNSHYSLCNSYSLSFTQKNLGANTKQLWQNNYPSKPGPKRKEVHSLQYNPSRHVTQTTSQNKQTNNIFFPVSGFWNSCTFFCEVDHSKPSNRCSSSRPRKNECRRLQRMARENIYVCVCTQYFINFVNIKESVIYELAELS